MNLTPGEETGPGWRGVDFGATFAVIGGTLAIVFIKLVVEALGVTRGVPLGFRGGKGGATMGAEMNGSPLSRSHILRMVSERHNMVRVTFAGRECHESISVPEAMIILRPVIM